MLFIRKSLKHHFSFIRKKLRATDRHDFGKNVRYFQAAAQIHTGAADCHYADAREG